MKGSFDEEKVEILNPEESNAYTMLPIGILNETSEIINRRSLEEVIQR